MQPRPEDYDFDLDEALASVVGIRAIIPGDAFTAESLGTERGGNGVVIGRRRPGPHHRLSDHRGRDRLDQHRRQRRCRGTCWATTRRPGSAWCRRWDRFDLPALPLGSSAAAEVGEQVVVGGAGGRQASLAARIIAKQEFAGYWEYVLDEAIFTAPAHPNWGGTAVIGPGRRPDRHRLAADPADGRQPAGRRRQHDRADRPAEADPGGPHHHRPSEPSGAAVARPLRHRDRRQRRRAGTGEPRPGAAGRPAHRRHHHGAWPANL